MSVVKVDNVSIKYNVGNYMNIGFKEYLIRRIRGEYKVKELWATKGISFSLETGDMLGIIGSNGAGKSTLLKAVSGIMVPTEGSVNVSGKIAALLELSAGFDSMLSVKENVYIRGAILGYSEEFINEKYDEIIEFAELKGFEEYLFGQLSSGMKSRLAFSIACLVNPQVLILDEVLSVGDGSFKKKSGDKIKEVISKGVTGILVSHSITPIRETCNKVLWMDHGKQIYFGEETEIVCNAYEEFLFTKVLPLSYEDIMKMSSDHLIRMEQLRKEKQEKKVKKLENMLNKGTNSAVVAAVNIIRESNPELINDEKYEEFIKDKM